MGYILNVMPDSPQPHRIEQAAQLLTKGQWRLCRLTQVFSGVQNGRQRRTGQNPSHPSARRKKHLTFAL